MEIRICILGIFFSTGIFGVLAQKSLDTLYANETNAVALFFPHPIRQAMTGHDGFVFAYDRERAGHVGLLQGVEGEGSNLWVVTTKGHVHAYILKYAKTIDRLYHYVREEDRIGEEKPKMLDWEHPEALGREVSYYENQCRKVLEEVPMVLAKKRKNGVRLRLSRMVHKGPEVYLCLDIKNGSEIDFEIDRLEVFRVNGSQKRRASYQEVAIKPLHRYGYPERVRKGEQVRFVLVLPKFVLGDREHLRLELAEKRGNRRLVLNH